MTRHGLAQVLYRSAWNGEHLDNALPEIQATFYRMADDTAEYLNITLED